MWKKEEIKPQGVPERPAVQVNPPAFSNASPATSSFQPAPSAPSAVSAALSSASIGQGIRIKGEVTGSEDLFVDGVVDGKLNLTNGSLTIGPNGAVKADVNAREVIVTGRIEGR